MPKSFVARQIQSNVLDYKRFVDMKLGFHFKFNGLTRVLLFCFLCTYGSILWFYISYGRLATQIKCSTELIWMLKFVFEQKGEKTNYLCCKILLCERIAIFLARFTSFPFHNCDSRSFVFFPSEINKGWFKRKLMKPEIYYRKEWIYLKIKTPLKSFLGDHFK